MKNYIDESGIGYRLEVEVLGGLSCGTYKCELLENSVDTIGISMPLKNGKLILLSVGQPIRVTYQGDKTYSFKTEIIGKKNRPVPMIMVPKPNAISPSGRSRLPGMTRVISVTSGKGGVGKTNFVVNLAYVLQKLGQRVMIIDADLGLANIDVLLGITPCFDLTHVIKGKKDITEVITQGPYGIKFIAGATGIQELTNLTDWQISQFITGLSALESYADIMLIDTGAGISSHVLSFALAADEVVVITNPEPTAIADAYAMIKIIAEKGKNHSISLLVNKTDTQDEAERTIRHLKIVTERFLGFTLNVLGYINNDRYVGEAVKRQMLFTAQYPSARASQCMDKIAQQICYGDLQVGNGTTNFFNRLFNLLSK